MTQHSKDDDFVICESADGFSLHAPGSSDEAIANGDAPYLISEPWPDDEHIIPDSAYAAARAELARRARRSAFGYIRDGVSATWMPSELSTT
jgi:hypothetical protein